jgi:hypothetical protein
LKPNKFIEPYDSLSKIIDSSKIPLVKPDDKKDDKKLVDVTTDEE